jgi:hypothetical protein
MAVRRNVTISVEENRVSVLWSDGVEHSAHFDMGHVDLFQTIMYDLSDALYPLLKKAGNPDYGSQFKRVPSDSARETSELRIIERECTDEKYELTYWQGEWSVRRSGETKTMTGPELFYLLMQMKGAV